MMPMMLSATSLDEIGGIRHGFFTRRGGVSRPPYDSLNCGLGSLDDPERVAANRVRAMDALGFAADALVTARQVHSAEVVIVEEPWPAEARPQVDALVTRTPGIVVGVLTADCAPVLLADADAGVVAAVHAGWRGAKDGVIDAAVAAMLDLGAGRCRMVAAIGPCIQQASYEVGPEFHAEFAAEGEDAGAFFRPSPREGRFMFDLRGYVASRLTALGLASVVALDRDTASDADTFFSYRRTTLNGGGDYGRSLSAIALEPR
jgi:YfiH family protein